MTGIPSPAQESTVPTLIIRPPRKWVPVDLHELWAYRELIGAFTMRDMKLRYKQTGLGIAWAVLQPLLTMVIFTIFFGGLAQDPVRWRAVSALCAFGPASLDALCRRIDTIHDNAWSRTPIS